MDLISKARSLANDLKQPWFPPLRRFLPYSTKFHKVAFEFISDLPVLDIQSCCDVDSYAGRFDVIFAIDGSGGSTLDDGEKRQATWEFLV